MKRTRQQEANSQSKRKKGENPLGDSEDVGVFPTDMWLLILNFVPGGQGEPLDSTPPMMLLEEPPPRVAGFDQCISEMSQTCKSLYKLCNLDCVWKMRYADKFNTPIRFLSDTVDSNFLAKDLKPRKDDPIQDLWQRRYQHRKSLKSAMPEPEDPDDEHRPYFNLKVMQCCRWNEEAALEEERRQYQVSPYRGAQPNTVIFIGSTGIPVTFKWDNSPPTRDYNFRLFVHSARKSQWKLAFEVVPNLHCEEDEGYYYPLFHSVVRVLTRISKDPDVADVRAQAAWRLYDSILATAGISEDAQCVHANTTGNRVRYDSDDEEYLFEGEEQVEAEVAGTTNVWGGTSLEGTLGTYQCFTVRKAATIKDQFQLFGVGYKAGNGYYLLTKNEKVSEKKKVLVIDKDGNFFDDHKVVLQKLKRKSMEGNICPMKDLKIFVQSSSPSRMMDIGVEWIALINVKK